VYLQIAGVLRRPVSIFSTVAIALIFVSIFLYFDEFYFVKPYLVAFVTPSRFPILALDIMISALSGIILTLSVYEIRAFPSRKSPSGRTGLAGIVAAFVAGACPCYYLVPLLAVAGGGGGVLAAVGILFFDYQVPIKFGSLALLLFTAYTQERSLRAACELPGEPRT
jgi:hypothetical protein